MSKERELLKKVISRDNKGDFLFSYDLYKEIKEFLAQPEQEPVAWCQMVEGKVQDLLTSFEMKDWLYDKSWIPLYTAPPKREPLSEDKLDVLAGANITDEGEDDSKTVYFIAGYYLGFRDAEKCHGIGGGG